MPIKPSTDDTIDVLACAYLASQNKTQIEIANDLGLSQATVSRLLKDAKEKKYFTVNVHFHEERIHPELMSKVIQRIYNRQVLESLREIAGHYTGRRDLVLRVFPSQRKADGRKSRLQEFSRQAAPFVKELLTSVSLCGVSWGTTLGELITALERPASDTPRTKNPIKVIPLGGEPIGTVPNSYSSSYLAADLGKTLNGEAITTPSLSMVPAFIPGDFNEVEMGAIWKMVSLVEAYEKVFGSRSTESQKNTPVSLVEQVEMILTSVGPAEALFGYIGSELIRTGMKIQELQRYAYGDICGVCIPRPNIPKEGKEKLKAIEERWTGVRREHLVACAAKSTKNKKPGVVVVAVGKEKAPFVLETIKHGLVNTLIIDEDLETTLKMLIQPDLSLIRGASQQSLD